MAYIPHTYTGGLGLTGSRSGTWYYSGIQVAITGDCMVFVNSSNATNRNAIIINRKEDLECILQFVERGSGSLSYQQIATINSGNYSVSPASSNFYYNTINGGDGHDYAYLSVTDALAFDLSDGGTYGGEYAIELNSNLSDTTDLLPLVMSYIYTPIGQGSTTLFLPTGGENLTFTSASLGVSKTVNITGDTTINMQE